MTDVWMKNEDDGGDVEFRNGNPVMSDGLSTSVLLSLWGGNDEDSGAEATDPEEWWANLDETEDVRKYRSRTQFLLKSMPLTPSNLVTIEEAATGDLAWMVSEGIATEVEASASITAPQRLRLDVTVTVADGTEYNFTFTENMSGA